MQLSDIIDWEFVLHSREGTWLWRAGGRARKSLMAASGFVDCVQTYLVLLWFALLSFMDDVCFTNRRQDPLPAKRWWLTLLWFLLYCSGLASWAPCLARGSVPRPLICSFFHDQSFGLDLVFLSESSIYKICIYFNTFLVHPDSRHHSNATNQSLLCLWCLGTWLDLVSPWMY